MKVNFHVNICRVLFLSCLILMLSNHNIYAEDKNNIDKNILDFVSAINTSNNNSNLNSVGCDGNELIFIYNDCGIEIDEDTDVNSLKNMILQLMAETYSEDKLNDIVTFLKDNQLYIKYKIANRGNYIEITFDLNDFENL